MQDQTSRTQHPPNRKRLAMQRLIGLMLVALQFTLAAILVLANAPLMAKSLSAWAIVAICGAGLHIWAMAIMGPRQATMTPEVKSDARLVSTGPYRYIRHPMYTALLLFCGGFLGVAITLWKAMVYLALACVLISKIAVEEKALRERFEEYAVYTKRTWRLLPLIW